MLDLTGIKGVIFDLDGTLVESSLDFAQMRADIGCPSSEDILAYIDAINCKRERSEADQIVLEHELNDAHTANILDIGTTMLEQVAQANLPKAIVTRNCRQATAIKMNKNQIEMDIVLTREDAPAKPDPTALLQIAEQWQCDAKDLLYVGDYVYDQQAAENAGMRFFMV